jgi:maleate cis-trans isomerase
VDELGRISADQVAGLARDTVTPDSDALFIACSQLPTHAIVGRLQSELKRPVWSSIQASAWRTKEKLS